MKKYFLHILIASLILVGCAKEQSTVPTKSQAEPIAFSQTMLKFSSMDEIHETYRMLASISPEERTIWYEDQGNFISQEKAAQMISDQISGCMTQKEGDALRDAYSDLFIFNYNPTDQDYTPYLPTNEIGVSMLANPFGNIEIAGEIVNVNTLKSYEDTWCAQIEKRDREALTRGVDGWNNGKYNYLYCYTNSRKMWAEATIDNSNNIFIRYAAQQKICGLWCNWHAYTNQFWHIWDYSIPVKNIALSYDFATIYSTRQYWMITLPHGSIGWLGTKTANYAECGIKIYSQGVGIENQGVLRIKF